MNAATLLMALKDLIKAARKERDLSQRAIALLIGISPGAVAQWETGGSKPSRDNLIEFAAIVGKKLDYFVSGEDLLMDNINVSDPEEIALVRLWRKVHPEERTIILKLVWSAGVPHAGRDADYEVSADGRRWTLKNKSRTP